MMQRYPLRWQLELDHAMLCAGISVAAGFIFTDIDTPITLPAFKKEIS